MQPVPGRSTACPRAVSLPRVVTVGGCLLLLGGLAAALTGCGRSDVELVPVRGKVTYGGGEWPKEGVLYFTSAEPVEGQPQRPALAHFDTDGSFKVTSWDEGDGLVPGEYRVAVECWKVPPTMESPQPPVSFVPEKYQSPQTSDLTVTIEPGQGSQDLKFDVPKP